MPLPSSLINLICLNFVLNFTLYMNAVSDWLIKGVFFFIKSDFVQLFPHCMGICPWEFCIGKYPTQRKIPSLNSLGQNRFNSELLWFLLSTIDKVKKMANDSYFDFYRANLNGEKKH